MNFSAALSLADSTLAALRAGMHPTGRTQPDATTTLDALTYNGPKGRGWQVTVTLRTPLTENGPMGQLTNTVRIVRHVGGETHRNRPDPTFAETKAALLAAHAAKVAALKAARDTSLAAGFEFGGKTIQTRNQVDIDNINGAALRAVSDPAFQTGWITADNSILPLDAAGVVAMQAAMITRGNQIYGQYVAARAALPAVGPIEAASTMDELLSA